MIEQLKYFKEKNYAKILQKEVNLDQADANETTAGDVYEEIVSKYRRLYLYGHSDSVFSVSISLDKKYVVSSSFDQDIRLWSIHSKATLAVYKGHFSPVYSVKFSPLGLYFASGGGDNLAYLWSANSIGPLRAFSGHLTDVEVKN